MIASPSGWFVSDITALAASIDELFRDDSVQDGLKLTEFATRAGLARGVATGRGLRRSVTPII